jgi:hypothetical protein
MRMMAVVLVAMVLGGPVFGRVADDPVRITVMPTSCVTPCTVRLTVRIAPNDANRSITIAAESAEFARSSTSQLDGSEAPLVHELLLEELPPGPYDVHVSVGRATGGPQERAAHFAVHDGL